jgi:hypothetical protein
VAAHRAGRRRSPRLISLNAAASLSRVGRRVLRRSTTHSSGVRSIGGAPRHAID